ncbi:MAG: ABC transporter ATP-binding protein [Deltaproteobacteria bacterium]|jgi:iron complex transport system ATP-binding protein|nr:ABC transporter ATP-binding protein [Deltaproteobacteria bacterium]
MTPILEVKGFSLVLGGVGLLKDISFTVNDGQYLSIIGPNGAGKSTLVKALLRLHNGVKTTGSILINGRDLHSYPRKELARLIGYAPQAGGWIPPYTIRELVLLSRYPRPDKKRDLAASDKALTLTGLTALADRPLNSLSGGERQKAYIAAALAQETPILALDEPSAFLDPKHAFELDSLLKDLNLTHHLTVITVTHDLNHPALAGGLALVLKKGNLLFFGEANALFKGSILEEAFEHRFIHLAHPNDGRPVVLSQ